MKTIVRIGQAIDSVEQISEAKLSTFGLAMLAEGFDKRRAELPEAILVVQKAAKGPVYITVGANPPELVAGDRKVFAVFCPPDSQEPVATFCAEAAAKTWAEGSCAQEGYSIRHADATDRVGIRPCVAVVIRNEADQVLYVRLAKTHQWTIPEGDLLVGESVESAARRTARDHLGLELGRVGMPAHVPYINVLFPELGHFLSLILVAHAQNEPEKKGTLYDAWTWGSASSPPEPQFVTVATIRRLATSGVTPASLAAAP